MYGINIQNNDIDIEGRKIWIYLTVEKKEIYLTPPENTSMKCHKVSIDTFLQIIKDGFYIHKNVFASYWGESTEVIYKLKEKPSDKTIKQLEFYQQESLSFYYRIDNSSRIKVGE